MVRPDCYWPVRAAEYVLKTSPRNAAWHKWSHEHWLVAGMFGFVGTALIAIVPGFSNATKAAEAAPARIELALPLPAVASDARLALSGWQTVRVGKGENLGSIFDNLKIPATTLHSLLAATSAPNPPVRLSSCTIIAFPVFLTDASTVSRSSGTRVRRSITSTDVPSAARMSPTAVERRTVEA